jgi:hypothetical protein
MTTKSYFACLFLIAPMALTLPALAQTRAAARMDSEPRVAFGHAQIYIGLKSTSCASSAQAQPLASADSAALTTVECKMFAHSYSHDSAASRVARLERFVLGTTRDGLPLQQRISLLLSDVHTGSKSAAAVPERIPVANTRGTNVPAANKSSVSKQAISADLSTRSKYPHLIELEQQICHRSYENEPVRQRLDRLENMAFGKPSTSVDLARRVDALDWYAFSAPPVRTAEYEFDDSQRSPDFRHFPALVSTSSAPQFVSVVDQIECLERTSFGRISANKPLEKRVSALEKHVYGTMQINTNEALTTRVGQLWQSVRSGSSSGANHTGV